MITIITNQKKYDCLQLLKEIELLLTKLQTTFQTIANYPFSEKDIKLIRQSNKWIILGGDGTILSAFAHFPIPIPPPLYGTLIPVNFGTLGYMAGIAEEEALPIIENYLQPTTPKMFKEEKRYILLTESHVEKDSTLKKSYSALNETTIRATQDLSPIYIEVKINGIPIVNVGGDGIIIATPTGSTAYSLSAGGPILSPEIEALVLTFISPHSLTVKPIVVARGDVIELTLLKNKGILGIDGVIKETLSPGQSIRCKLGETPLTFIQPAQRTAYQSLKQKLHWGT